LLPRLTAADPESFIHGRDSCGHAVTLEGSAWEPDRDAALLEGPVPRRARVRSRPSSSARIPPRAAEAAASPSSSASPGSRGDAGTIGAPAQANARAYGAGACGRAVTALAHESRPRCTTTTHDYVASRTHTGRGETGCTQSQAERSELPSRLFTIGPRDTFQASGW
jgi:hypothetical protein